MPPGRHRLGVPGRPRADPGPTEQPCGDVTGYEGVSPWCVARTCEDFGPSRITPAAAHSLRVAGAPRRQLGGCRRGPRVAGRGVARGDGGLLTIAGDVGRLPFPPGGSRVGWGVAHPAAPGLAHWALPGSACCPFTASRRRLPSRGAVAARPATGRVRPRWGWRHVSESRRDLLRDPARDLALLPARRDHGGRGAGPPPPQTGVDPHRPPAAGGRRRRMAGRWAASGRDGAGQPRATARAGPPDAAPAAPTG